MKCVLLRALDNLLASKFARKFFNRDLPRSIGVKQITLAISFTKEQLQQINLLDSNVTEKESDVVKNIRRHATLLKDRPAKDVFLEHLN